MAQPYNLPSQCAKPELTYIVQTKKLEERSIYTNNADLVTDFVAYTGAVTNWLGKTIIHSALGFIYQLELYCRNTAGVGEQLRIGFKTTIDNNNSNLERFEISTTIPPNFLGWHTILIQQFWQNDICFIMIKGHGANTTLYIDNLGDFDTYESNNIGSTWIPLNSRLCLRVVYTAQQFGMVGIAGVVSIDHIIRPPTVISNVAGRVSLNVPYVWRLFHQIVNYSFMKGCVFNRNLYIGTLTALPAGASIFRFTGNEFTNVFTDPNACYRIDSLIVYNDLLFEHAYDPANQTTVYSSANGIAWNLELTPPAPHILMPLTPAKHNNLLFTATQTRLYYRNSAGAWNFVDLSGYFGNIRSIISWNGYLYIAGVLVGGTRIIRSADGLTNWETVYNNPLGVWVFSMEIYQNKLWAIDNMLNNDYIINSESGVLGSWNIVFDSKHPTVRCYKLVAVRGFLYNLTYNGIAPLGNCRVFKSDGQAFIEDYSSPPMSIYDLVEYNDLMLGLGNQIYLNEIRNISSEPKIFNATAPNSVAVTNVATLIPFTASGINFNRSTIVIQPFDGDVYWGYTNGVTAINGLLLEQGDTLTIKNYVGTIYCIRAGGVNVDVRYSEFYE